MFILFYLLKKMNNGFIVSLTHNSHYINFSRWYLNKYSLDKKSIKIHNFTELLWSCCGKYK